mmetsp:Transcript_36249/g.64869  ORF Transcript_36249/g.64869 Transcript_36249/m.64869 type:complete len:204 (-) Transcript_36249:483-1094(-)
MVLVHVRGIVVEGRVEVGRAGDGVVLGQRKRRVRACQGFDPEQRGPLAHGKPRIAEKHFHGLLVLLLVPQEHVLLPGVGHGVHLRHQPVQQGLVPPEPCHKEGKHPVVLCAVIHQRPEGLLRLVCQEEERRTILEVALPAADVSVLFCCRLVLGVLEVPREKLVLLLLVLRLEEGCQGRCAAAGNVQQRTAPRVLGGGELLLC